MRLRDLSPSVLLLAGLLGGYFFQRPRAATAEAGAPVTDREVALSVSRAISDVSSRVVPAVVSVRTRWLSGSGVFVSPDGLIVTNNHVTNGVRRCTVELVDGRRLSARVIGTDPDTDLALLDVEGEGFEHLLFSDDPPPQIGTWVLAIGNPLGYDHTVTFGIISARSRQAGLRNVVYEDFLQTDAAINLGNSGGPLIDLDGRVVGINTAKEVVPGGSQGLGFAIPAYMVRDVVSQLLEKGFVERGWFGIEVSGEGDSVRVNKVIEDSPAAHAGMESGDIVLAIGEHPIGSRRDLFDAIAALPPGTRVSVKVERHGTTRQVEVEVGQRP